LTALKNLVKEAMGNKTYSSLEIVHKMILFKPSLDTIRNDITHHPGSLSAIHSLVNPFLQRIRDPEVDSKTIGKVKECLNRIVIGISHNISSTTDEMLPFVYATVFLFLSLGKKEEIIL
jgi:U3 small nucleolar RNA-associated protein 20